MKVYFVRHGQSLDDVYNEYGSWSNRGLSPEGTKTAFMIARRLHKLEPKYDLLLSSPLPRSLETSEIISAELGVKMVEEPYLKERNTYGLLTGVNKDLAIEEYPRMNAAFLEGRYIPASERYRDCVQRVKIFLEKMKKIDEDVIICSTHGHIITIIIEEFLGRVRNNIGNGSILGVEIKDGRMKIFHTDGVDFTTDEDIARGVELRKFKKD